MKFLLRPVVPLILVFSLQIQNEFPKYSVLKTKNGDAYLLSLNQLADHGYRVLDVDKNYTVLRLEAHPSDTYRYVRCEVKGGPAQFTNWINEQGALGYHWLWRTGLLEKAPHPRNYEYRYSRHGGSGPSNGRELSAMVEDGYRPSGMVGFSNSILGASTGTTYEMYFEREVNRRGASPQATANTIEIADAMRVGNVMKRVDELAKRGYRFLSLYHSQKGGGIALMMEKCPDDCAGRYEYRYFDAKEVSQVERELNALGKDGFRVVPDALDRRPHLLERDTHIKRSFYYRVIEPSDAASLQHSLNRADLEGYTPIGFVWHAGAFTAQGFLLLDKETTASAAPWQLPLSL